MKRNPYTLVLLLPSIVVLFSIGVFVLIYNKGISNEKALAAIPISIAILGALATGVTAALKIHEHILQAEKDREIELRNRRIEEEQREDELRNRHLAEEQRKRERDNRLRERCERAAALLGHDQNDADRCDAISDLEDVAKESAECHDRIQRILRVFVQREIQSTSREAKQNRPSGDVFDAAYVLSSLYRKHHLQAELYKLHADKLVLRYIRLEGAKLCYSNFNGTILSEANLQAADLHGASFDRTELEATNLIGADLREAHRLTAEQLLTAIIDRTTKLDRKLRAEYDRLKAAQE